MFATYKDIAVNEFDANYFISVFGVFEKENSALKTEMIKLKEELLVSVESGKLKDSDIDAYKSLLSQFETDNFLDFFNAERYKRIIDLALKEVELNVKELFLRLEKWLIPEDSSKEHQQRVFNVYRELGIEDRDSSYFNSLSEIGDFILQIFSWKSIKKL